ncbi:hypothetical protein N8T08_010682 [Aspergillus melleus]|uniref:Uncharacterized protein n=1 Tax=Aspergillus melleus TaxID=138277 RepID=A0ACC3BC01_9EURO|nr:hypothetical protein N8T08_010682 [Aspergillus melleus]
MAEPSFSEKLSPLDLLMPRTYIRVLLVFEAPVSTTLAIQNLQSGLHKLSKQTPWLTGRVIPGESGQDKPTSPEIRWDATTAPSIVDKGTIQTSYEWACAQGMPGESIQSDVWPVSDMIDDTCFTAGAPVFAASIFRFTDQGLGLCVCMHHNVVDANGFSTILRLWAQNVSDPESSFSATSQTRIQRLSEALPTDLPETSTTSTETLLARHPEFSTTPPTLPKTLPSCTSKIFPISKHWIDVLGELMRPYTSKRLTTNTVLCALIWATITRTRMAHNPSLEHKPSRLSMAVNGRPRISQIFSTPDSPFSGNAIIYSLTTLPAQTLAASDQTPVRALAEICNHIAESQSPSTINSRHIAEVYTLADRVETGSLFVGWDLFGSRDLTITSWADFDLYGVHFGKVMGRPRFVRLPYMEADGVAIILPRQRSVSQEVLEVMVMLRRDHMEALELDPMWQTLGSGG